ncbi:hypothetical protein EJ04DRAFT_529708, partial [Polyplosphaeria fusca]
TGRGEAQPYRTTDCWQPCSLGILIVYIGTALFGIGMFYTPQLSKAIEDIPFERYRSIQHANKLRTESESGPSSPEVLNEGECVPETPVNSIQQSVHLRKSGNKVGYEIIELDDRDMSTPDTAQEEDAQVEEGYIDASSVPSEAELLSNVVETLQPTDEAPRSNGVHIALMDLIRAQEASLEASRRLLKAFNKDG